MVSALRISEGGSVAENSHQGVERFLAASRLLEADLSDEPRWGSREAYDELALESPQTAKDPILFRGGDANLYGYSLNDPVNLLDPTELATVMNIAGEPKADSSPADRTFTS